jgi:NAD(P)-dependent dehydrogenase (short-subunit alcohol dehydrogenase family)
VENTPAAARKGKSMSQKTVLVTGSTDGVGKLVAARFALDGARVLLHGRNPAKGAAVVEEIRAKTGNEALEFVCADFAGLAAVRRMATEVSSRHDHLDILINNAAVGGSPAATLARAEPLAPTGDGAQVTAALAASLEGYELRFAVNYLAGYLLTDLLMPLLARSSSPRVVQVSSSGQAPIDFADLMLTRGQDEMHAYKQSKFAQILFTFELAERLREIAGTAVAIHPADFMNTKMVIEAGYQPTTTAEEGAAAVYWGATDPALAGRPELFFNGVSLGRAKFEQAYDHAARRRLWELSAALVDVPA